MSGVAALIYAGGRGERLGGAIKANLEIGGVRLLDRVTAALGSIPSPILVAHGAATPESLGLRPVHIPIPDAAPPSGGPLAGLAGALAWCAGAAEPPPLILTIAVDTPFVPPDYAGRMLAALAAGDSALVAAYAGQTYPTNALWRVWAYAELPWRLREGTAPPSLRRLAEAAGARSLDWPPTAGGDPFANVNTPEDLASLEARAQLVSRGN